MDTVAFMHVGPDVQLATLMARSVRHHNPDVRIVQVADEEAPQIEGVDLVARRKRTHNNLMLFRMQAFAELPIDGPTWFLDTDMLCHKPLHWEGPEIDVAVCVREFNRNQTFNHQFRGMDFSEYEGRLFKDLYPYVGCATLVINPAYWPECRADMEALPEKFHHWYGDQESIRNIVASGRYRVGILQESVYACLPEFEDKFAFDPIISHYKGQRKAKMLERAAADGYL